MHAVVHAHPPAVIAADLAGVPLVPMVGAYNIPAATLAADGIPVYPRGVLISTATLAAEMLDAMGDRPVCVLRGHGVTTTGATLEQAVARALARRFAGSHGVGVVALGGSVGPLPAADLELLPDLGSGFNDVTLLRHHEMRLDALGWRWRADQREVTCMSDMTTIAAHIERGMIPAYVYSDPDVFELERERICSARAWVFLAHESEIPAPGDYVVRRVVDDSFIVVRDEVGHGARALQHVPPPRHAGVPRRARQRLPLPLPVPRLVVPQRRLARRAAVPPGRLRRRRRVSARGGAAPAAGPPRSTRSTG